MARKPRFRKAKNGIISMDLSQIEDLVYKLQTANETIISRLEAVCDRWGEMSKTEYANRISYAQGFNKPTMRSKRPYYDVQIFDEHNGLTVCVGHQAFIAKFLEVGTREHIISHRTRNGDKKTVSIVAGIRGSKALANVFNRRRAKLAEDIENAVNNAIIGG